MEEAPIREWQVSRGRIWLAMLGAALSLLIGMSLVYWMLLSGDRLRLRTIPIPTSALFILNFASELGRTTRHAWLQLAVCAIMIVGLIFYFLHPPPG